MNLGFDDIRRAIGLMSRRVGELESIVDYLRQLETASGSSDGGDEIADDLAAHIAATTDVHGIADTADLETQAGAQAKADAVQANLDAHTADEDAHHTAFVGLDAVATDGGVVEITPNASNRIVLNAGPGIEVSGDDPVAGEATVSVHLVDEVTGTAYTLIARNGRLYLDPV